MLFRIFSISTLVRTFGPIQLLSSILAKTGNMTSASLALWIYTPSLLFSFLSLLLSGVVAPSFRRTGWKTFTSTMAMSDGIKMTSTFRPSIFTTLRTSKDAFPFRVFVTHTSTLTPSITASIIKTTFAVRNASTPIFTISSTSPTDVWPRPASSSTMLKIRTLCQWKSNTPISSHRSKETRREFKSS